MSEEQTLTAEQEKILQLETELGELKDKYLRTLAEHENARKRMQKEKQENTRFAIENAFAEILAPLDNFENALSFTSQMSDEIKMWAQGFQMILTQFKDAFAQQGIQPFESVGQFFDPHLHQAVEVEETEEKPEGIILQEFVKGYRCGERTIRPARVKVAKRAGQELPKQEEIKV